ncbi:MAG: septum formation initiator family protein [Candidatus Binataceae bacterium]|jgi:cell division protein FtsB
MAKLNPATGMRGLNLILTLVLILLALDCLINPLGMRDLAILRQDRAQMVATRDRMLAEKTQHEATIALLNSDDAYLQRMIRQELGYIRPDELIYRFTAIPGGNDSETGAARGQPPSK